MEYTVTLRATLEQKVIVEAADNRDACRLAKELLNPETADVIEIVPVMCEPEE